MALRPLVSYVAVFCLGIALSEILQALLLGVLFLDMRRFILPHVESYIRLATKYFTHDFVFNWIFVNIFDNQLFLVVFSVEVMNFLVIMKVTWFGIYYVFMACWR